MSLFFDRGHFDPSRETGRESKEVVERGWQQRLRQALGPKEKTKQELERRQGMILESETFSSKDAVVVVQGTLRDAILMATAAEWDLEDRRIDQPKHRNVVVGTQSAENAMAGAYAISAAISLDSEVGGFVGYATGQGEKITPGETRIGVSAKGNLARLVLDGRMNRDDVYAIVIDAAEADDVPSQLLISALKYWKDKDRAPTIILVSRDAKKAKFLADFFSTDPEAEMFFEQRSGAEEIRLPEDIHYEPEGARRINETERVSELLQQILGGTIHADQDVMIFLRNGQMLKDVTKLGSHTEFFDKVRKSSTRTNNPNLLETNSHYIWLLSSETPLEERLRIQLGTAFVEKPDKPVIVLSTLPAEMLGVSKKFDVVVDTCRSAVSDPRSNSTIPPHEAFRRAAFAKEQGTCYRLTTEASFRSSSEHHEFLDASFDLWGEKEVEFDSKVSAAGINPKDFPRLSKRRFDYQPDEEKEINREPEIKLNAAEKMARRLDVEPQIGQLVLELEAIGERDIGLAAAACLRQDRIFEDSFNDQDKIATEFKTRSDILLRLRILADFCLTGNVPEGVQLASLRHIKAVLERWNKNFDFRVTADRIRNLSYQQLTECLVRAMPENLAFFEDIGPFHELSFSDGHGYRLRSGRSAFGDKGPVLSSRAEIARAVTEREESLRNFGWKEWQIRNDRESRESGKFEISEDLIEEEDTGLFIVVATGGPEKQYATALHPLTLSQARRLMPERVRTEVDEPVFNEKFDTVSQTERVLVSEPSLSELGPYLRRDQVILDGQRWRIVKENWLEASGEAAEQVKTEANRKKVEERRQQEKNIEALGELRARIQGSLEETFRTLEVIFENSRGATRTSAETRLIAIRFQQARLSLAEEDSNPTDIEQLINDQIGKIPALARKAARENKWRNENWQSELHSMLGQVAGTVEANDLVQEAASDDPEILPRIIGQVRDRILAAETISRIQKGQEVDLSKMIDEVLDEVIK
ncbi:MAG: hypothetical protein V1664_02760 [Candidatus Uhrbacteria bacterium]